MNRLNELKRQTINIDIEGDDIESDLSSRSKQHTQGAPQDAVNFLSDIDTINTNIGKVREATNRIKELNQTMIQATTTDKELSLNNELEPLVKSTTKKATITKDMLRRLREDSVRLKSNANSTSNTPEIRMRETLTKTAINKFVEVMKDYQNAQTSYRLELKKKVKRQIQIVKPSATSEEIDSVFQSNQGSSAAIRAAILKGDAAESIQNTYRNLENRYQDVITLEASITELHQMFLDLALLVEQQGDLLDQIEHHVNNASEFVSQGNADYREVIRMQKEIVFRRCLCAGIIIIILAVIAAIIAAKASGSF